MDPAKKTQPPALPTLPTGRYRHYKGGEYEVMGVARHSETLEPLVVYRPLYNATGWWVRPHAMFFESITIDGVSLTVNQVEDHGDVTHFAVNLIPHTQAVTTLGTLASGQAVNIEIDVLARYLQRMEHYRGQGS